MCSVVMQIDTSALPWCQFARPPCLCVITSLVCSLSITYTFNVYVAVTHRKKEYVIPITFDHLFAMPSVSVPGRSKLISSNSYLYAKSVPNVGMKL